MGFNTYPNNPWPLPSDGVGSGGSSYVLPTASADTLGGVKVGSGLSIADGVLSVAGESGVLYGGEKTPENFTLPSGAVMQPLLSGAYSINFGGGTGDIFRVAVSNEKIDLTNVSKIIFVGTWHNAAMNDNFQVEEDISASTGEKYLSFGYFSNNAGNGMAYALTDTDTPTASDKVAIVTGTGTTQYTIISKIYIL